MQFELEAKVLNGKVVTNAKELLANIDNGLKHYDYVVTENTYEQAKKDIFGERVADAVVGGCIDFLIDKTDADYELVRKQ